MKGYCYHTSFVKYIQHFFVLTHVSGAVLNFSDWWKL